MLRFERNASPFLAPNDEAVTISAENCFSAHFYWGLGAEKSNELKNLTRMDFLPGVVVDCGDAMRHSRALSWYPPDEDRLPNRGVMSDTVANTRDSHSAMNRVEVITSVERRRRWSRSEKEVWVTALMEPGLMQRRLRGRLGLIGACCIVGVNNSRRVQSIRPWPRRTMFLPLFL